MYINIKPYKLISFDIFDTLLLRAVAKPIDIFEILWERILEKNLYLNELSAYEFMKIRTEMERRGRELKANKEVTLAEIYDIMPNHILLDKEAVMEMEIQIEKEYCYINDEIYQLVKNASKLEKKVVLLSDMYLSKNQILDILSYNDVDITLFDDIIISNENKSNKQNGMLYDVLLEKYSELSPEQILHIGDNKNGDYIQAKKKGIQAIYYDVIPDKMYGIYDYEKIRHNIPQAEILSLRKISVSEKKEQYKGNIELEQAYELGASVIGPFLSLYIQWVVDRLVKSNIHEIYPLMREGYLLAELLIQEATSRNYQLKVHPIYISRKVTYIPSIEKINQEEIENIFGTRNLNIEEVFNMLGISIDSIPELDKYKKINLKESHQLVYGEKTLKDYLIQCLLLPSHIEKVEAYVVEQRQLLVDYLKQEIESFHNVATIDIGFFGRIQMWTEKCLDIEKIPFHIKHFLAIGITGDKVYDGMDFEGYYGTYSQNSDLFGTIHRTPDVIEKLISVTEGSTIGYERKDNKVVPIKAEPLGHTQFEKASFDGVLTFQKNWFLFRKRKPLLADKCLKNRRETLKIVHRLIDMPRLVEVKAIAQLQADTNFGTNYVDKIITDDNIQLLHEKGIEYVDRCNISYTYKNSMIVWPKGLVTLEDEYHYVRLFLKKGVENSVVKSMQDLVEQVVADGIKEVALYGAGENGRQFFFLCQMYHLKVKCFIDRKESIWGTRREGIPIMGLQEAVKLGEEIFIITSLFSISEIRDTIIDSFKVVEKEAKIYSV